MRSVKSVVAKWLRRGVVGGVVFGLSPLAASAQSIIAGTVRDTSDAVLPGVTVEASSPVLIERTRVAVTDDLGRYRIIDLRPGTYSITFTLPGFSSVKRDGIVLPANFTASVNVELGVSAIAETVTVSGASPLVDVQSATARQVLNRELLDLYGAAIEGYRAQVPETDHGS